MTAIQLINKPNVVGNNKTSIAHFAPAAQLSLRRFEGREEAGAKSKIKIKWDKLFFDLDGLSHSQCVIWNFPKLNDKQRTNGRAV